MTEINEKNLEKIMDLISLRTEEVRKEDESKGNTSANLCDSATRFLEAIYKHGLSVEQAKPYLEKADDIKSGYSERIVDNAIILMK